MPDVKHRIAAAVRAARKLKRLSQQEVADAIGTTLETVSKCERGASVPSVEVFLAMVRVLGLDVADLAANSDDRTDVSTSRARQEAEVMAVARSISDTDLQLFADFGKLLERRRQR